MRVLWVALAVFIAEAGHITLAPTVTGGKLSDNYGKKHCPRLKQTCTEQTRCEVLELTKNKKSINDDNLKPFKKIYDPKTKRSNLRKRHLRIRSIMDWNDSAEFFAYTLYVLNQLLFAEKHELIGSKAPFVYMPESSMFHADCYEGGNVTNFWERVYEPISNVNYKKIPEDDIWEFSQKTIQNIHFHKDAIRSLPYQMDDGKNLKGDVATENWLGCQRGRAQALIDKYIRVNPATEKLAERMQMELFPDNERTVCAHVSGSDKFMSSPKSIHQFEHHLTSFLSAEPKAKALVVSENFRFVNKMMGHFGNRIVKMPELYVKDESSAKGKKAITEHIMIQTVLLAKCDKLVKSWSLAPEFSLYFHRQMKTLNAPGMSIVDLDLNKNSLDDKQSACYVGHKCEDEPLVLRSKSALLSALKSGSCTRRCTAHRILKQKGKPAKDMKGEKTAVLVVAHWQENLAWLEKQPYCYLVMEKKGNGDDVGKDPSTVVVNKGNEASSFLQFIGLNYNNLPDSVLMVHGDHKSEHSVDLVPMISALSLDAYPYASLNGIHFPFLEYDDVCDLHTFWTQIIGPEEFTPRSIIDVSTACCAQFMVSKERILKRSQNFYDRLYDFSIGSDDEGHDSAGAVGALSKSKRAELLAKHPKALPGCEKNLAVEFNSFTRGEVLELSWHKIFGEEWRSSVPDPKKLCGSQKLCPQNLPIVKKKHSLFGVVGNETDAFWYPANSFIQRFSKQKPQLKAAGLGQTMSLVREGLPDARDLSFVENLTRTDSLFCAGRNDTEFLSFGQGLTHKMHHKGNKTMFQISKPEKSNKLHKYLNISAWEEPTKKQLAAQSVAQAAEAVLKDIKHKKASKKASFMELQNAHIKTFARLMAKNSFHNKTLNVLLWDDKSCGMDFFGLRVEPFLEFSGCGVPMRFYSSLHRNMSRKMDAVVVSDLSDTHLNSFELVSTHEKKPRGQQWFGCEMDGKANPWFKNNFKGSFFGTGKHADVPFTRYSYATLGDSIKHNLHEPKPLAWVDKIPGVAVMEHENCKDGHRSEFVSGLVKAFNRTHSIGDCWKNTNLMTSWLGGKGMGYHVNRMANLRPYMFTLCHDQKEQAFVSECVFQALAVGSVPIYRGPHNIESLVPCQKCVINANNFESPQDVASIVADLIEDREQYDQLLQWKKGTYSESDYPGFSSFARKSVDGAICRFAKKVRRAKKLGKVAQCGNDCIKKVHMLQRISP